MASFNEVLTTVHVIPDPHGSLDVELEDAIGYDTLLVTFHSGGSQGNCSEAEMAAVLDLTDDQYDWGGFTNAGFAAIHDHPRAFFLSCYEHGLEAWFVKGHPGPQCQWDTADYAGIILIPEGFTDPEATAISMAETFTAYRNGEVYYIETRNRDGEVSDTCHGYIGAENALEVANLTKGRWQDKLTYADIEELSYA